jgi:NitT/TauT family transport system ATP-binding protein
MVQRGEAVNSASKLIARSVSVGYHNQKRWLLAVDRVSVEVSNHEFVSIVGPSGSGKSTFLMAIDGLVPVAGGELIVDGVAVNGPGRDRAVVFQEASLFPWRTVGANIEFALLANQLSKVERNSRVVELLSLVGLSEFAKAYPSQLSGGMQQRVNLARALAANPKLLLLDEPFASLDAQTREVMQEELLRICSAEHTTALLVTHQIDEAIYLSDRVVVFGARPGHVLAEFKVPFDRPRRAEVRQDPQFIELNQEIWKIVRAEYDRTTVGTLGQVSEPVTGN